MRFFLLIFFLLITFFSCKKENKNTIDVSHIPVSTKVDRFEEDFYKSSKENLNSVKKKYPMLFPHSVDSIWIQKIESKDEQELFSETQKIYKDFREEENKLKSLFQYIKYYNPKFKVPKVITLLSNIDYENRVLYSGQFLFISLDVYLGENHRFYADYPKYIKQNNTKNHIIVDVANAIIDKQIRPKNNRTFLEKVIFEGKKMYLLDAYLPKVLDQEKIGYSAEKFDWAVNSEEQVWKYFIDKELLYSTNQKLNNRFLETAPFSKFYLQEDSLSPGRIGVFMGWQIVRSFMQNNNVSLHQLINTKEEEIFKKSRYKPKR